MAITIDDTGIHTETLEQIIERKTNEKLALYPDGVFDQNTPDGQEIRNLAQVEFDFQDVVLSIYNNTTPNGAEGIYLDRLSAATSSTYRDQGTKTIVDVEVTTNRDAVALGGLDSNIDEVFTVADGASNNFQLNNSITLPTAGTYSLTFVAENVGEINTLPNTITVIKTQVVGVTDVTNPTTETTTGTDKDTDNELRDKRALRVSAPSTGYLNGLEAKLVSLSGVVSTIVQENDTDATDANGLKPHSIRVIIQGGTDEDIATTIVESKTAGCGTNGDESYDVVLNSGDIRTIKFDRSTPKPLTVRVELLSGASKQSLIEEACLAVKFQLQQTATVQQFYEAVSTVDGAVAKNIDLSLNGVDYFNFIEPVEDTDVFLTTTINFI